MYRKCPQNWSQAKILFLVGLSSSVYSVMTCCVIKFTWNQRDFLQRHLIGTCYHLLTVNKPSRDCWLFAESTAMSICSPLLKLLGWVCHMKIAPGHLFLQVREYPLPSIYQVPYCQVPSCCCCLRPSRFCLLILSKYVHIRGRTVGQMFV